MIGKYLDVIFRHRWLILLPPLLIPLIVTPVAWLSMPKYYQTWTGIWVDRPKYLTGTDDFNNFISPSQQQANRVSELIQTRSFLNTVAARTALAPLIGSEMGEDRVRQTISRGTALLSSGDHLLVIGFKADTPTLAMQVATALVDEVRERLTAERVSQASFAVSFTETRLQEAEARLTQANEAVRKYVAANPRLTSLDPSRGIGSSAAARLTLPTAAIDPQLAEILKRAEIEQREVERTRATLEQARFDASASLEAQDMRFQIVDPARMPTAPTLERRKVMMFAALATIVGVGISGVIAVLLVAGDRTARNETDLEALGPVIGVIPPLQTTPLGKGADAELARIRVGQPAGTVLPRDLEATP